MLSGILSLDIASTSTIGPATRLFCHSPNLLLLAIPVGCLIVLFSYSSPWHWCSPGLLLLGLVLRPCQPLFYAPDLRIGPVCVLVLFRALFRVLNLFCLLLLGLNLRTTLFRPVSTFILRPVAWFCSCCSLFLVSNVVVDNPKWRKRWWQRWTTLSLLNLQKNYLHWVVAITIGIAGRGRIEYINRKRK